MSSGGTPEPKPAIQRLAAAPSRAPAVRPRSSGAPHPPSRTPGTSTVVDCAIYVDGRRVEPEDPHRALEQARAGGGFVWLGLYAPDEVELGAIAESYGLHPLAVEDAVFAHQRPKLDHYAEGLFMVLKTATYLEHGELTSQSEVVETGEIMVFVAQHYVITVRHGAHGELADLRRSLEAQPDLLRLGPSAVLYAVADHVVDAFVDVATAVEDDVDELEASVFSPVRTDDVGRLYQLKRELMQLRRAVAPLEVPLQKLAERPVDGVIPDQMRAYFRDVLDHAIRVSDQVTALDELLSSILQASLARAAMADNQDVRRISAWAAMIAVPTLITGVYGMNFDFMPELAWRYGYFFCLLLIVVVCLVLYRSFKRNNWL
jgi:magnesium transporter